MFRTFLLVLVASSLLADGFDSPRLAHIPKRLSAMVENGDISGAVILLARDGKVALHEAVGFQDVENHKAMRPDSIFQIMSMTKPVTGVAVMMLVEEGKIVLDDPVERYLPEFKGQMLLDDKTKTLRKPARPISVRDLMTHTSGLPSEAAALPDLYTKMDTTLGDAVAQFAKGALQFEPGTVWRYSNSGIATLGRIIEVVSKQPFEQFVTSRILEPLGMTDSFFFAPKDKQSRIALVYTRRDDQLVRADAKILGGDSAAFRPGAKYPAPEFGMYSTARDLFAFYQMMLNEGAFNGKRLLSPAAVRTMTRTHTGDLKTGFLPGGTSGFGLTWEITKDAPGTTTLLSEGTFSHAGAFGTQGWVDKDKRVVGIFLIQKTGTDSQWPKSVAIQMANAAVLD